MIVLERTDGKVPGTDALERPSEMPARFTVESRKQPGIRYVVRYRPDERCNLTRMSSSWLYVSTPLGLDCYPDLRRLLRRLSETGIETALAELENMRLVAFVAYEMKTEEIHFGRSLDGFCSLFVGKRGARLVVSDSKFEVARLLGGVTFSAADEAQWREHSRLNPEGSFLDGVSRCFAGAVYRFDPQRPAVTHRRLMAPSGDALSHAGSVDFLQDELIKLFASYGTNRIALRLSGGIDSRVLLVGFLEAVKHGVLRKDQLLLTSLFFHRLDCDESGVIREIARLSGLEWIGIEATPQNVHQAYELCLQLPSPQFATSFMGTLCMQEASKRDVKIIVSGHGGDEVFDFDTFDILSQPFSKRLKLISLIRGLRNPGSLLDECKVLALAALGRKGARSYKSLLANCGIAIGDLKAHRLGRRVLLAQGIGYEASAQTAAQLGLLVDVPLLRAPFLTRFDPLSWHATADHRYKSVACAYMERCAPEIACVATRKVFFGSVLNAYYPPTRLKCDQLDYQQARRYASSSTYTDWCKRMHRHGGFDR